MTLPVGIRVAIASTLVLSACATVSPTAAPDGPAATAERAFRQQLSLGGRLSVRYQGPQKEEAIHGSFSWAQTAERTTVTLLSPLGQTVALIEAGPAGATMTQAGQPLRVAADVDTLTAEALGWPLPVAGMRDWLQGFATDPEGRRAVASPARDTLLTRDGWRIHYAAWSDDGRPRRIDLARNTQQAGEVSIRIVIDTWQAS
ncbi:MAG TPA: lipoprotein insertase outer membrane protein LolB [Noviherbaspirillum sp.]|jgi:outer membrane lipoprotein LolB|uniref:lipoprotein insertase outer membrane protein LolB n=1 Tax=Noviherbaspirillum sp. TaxID=1926288 RepID=UPI002F933ACD